MITRLKREDTKYSWHKIERKARTIGGIDAQVVLPISIVKHVRLPESCDLLRRVPEEDGTVEDHLGV